MRERFPLLLVFSTISQREAVKEEAMKIRVHVLTESMGEFISKIESLNDDQLNSLRQTLGASSRMPYFSMADENGSEIYIPESVCRSSVFTIEFMKR